MTGRSARRVLTVLVLVGVCLTALVGAHATAAAQTSPTQPETDNTVTRIAVHENASATWTLQIRTRLETDQQVEEYRTFQQRFRENKSRYIASFSENIRGVVTNAENATGRQMQATAFRASTSIQSVPRRWGVVTYEFRWTNFAAQSENRLVVGDVFQGGLFISRNDSLEIVAPPSYRITSVDPEPDESGDGVVSWTGREDFADERPQVVFTPVTPTPSPVITSTEPVGEGQGIPWITVGIVGLVFAGVLGAVYWRWGQGGAPGEGGPKTGGEGGRGPSSEEGGTSEAPAAEPPGEELLTDEDRVQRLLAEQDGRMRQKEIGDELDWSKSKTSRVLSRMTDEGRVEKLRLGRENVIELTDEE